MAVRRFVIDAGIGPERLVAATEEEAQQTGQGANDGGGCEDGLDDDPLRVQPPILLRLQRLCLLEVQIVLHEPDFQLLFDGI
jgi:hypothetical protein